MKKNNLLKNATLMAALGFSLMFAACKKEDDNTTTDPDTNTGLVEVKDSIAGSITWKASNKYLLKGYVYVVKGATLTIEPGTIIKGDKDTKGTLIVEPGARIMAKGTATAPIVFTSNLPKGSRNYGDWGGVVICGEAPVNSMVNGVKPIVEGGPRTRYGGNNPNDNSGTLQYVRIEFGGIALSPNNEVNGLSLNAVGAGTVVDHVQVSYSGDDSFEWFGGTVNAKYLISHRAWDDDFDTDNGYAGKNQFLVVLRDPNAADNSGSKGFESDNDASGSNNAPQTSAIFSNATVVGPLVSPTSTAYSSQFVAGAHIRRNSAISIMNSVIMGWPAGLLVDANASGSTAKNASEDKLSFKNNIIAGIPTGSNAANGQKEIIYVLNGAGSLTPTNIIAADSSAWGTYQGPLSWFNNAVFKNRVYKTSDNVRLLSAFNLTSPNFTPTSTSPIVYKSATEPTTPAVAPNFTDSKTSDSFFEKVNFIGAFSGAGRTADNWTLGWANFDPQNTDY